MDDGDRRVLQAWRERIARAHEDVPHGRYDAALAVFVDARGILARTLGADHPEVEELDADIEAVRAMAGVADFGEQVGFKGWKPVVPPDET